MRVKARRLIIGMVAQVTFPCGCNAQIAQGRALTTSSTKTLVEHRCTEWKKHKYALADAEYDLAMRLWKHRRPPNERGRLS